MREALEEHGVSGELLALTDGARGIGYIQALETSPCDCPDLIIIDLNLPRRSGREVLKAMRQSVKCRDATIVVLSSSDARQDREDAAALGADRYIRKPIRLDDFLRLGAVFKSLLDTPPESL